MAKRLQRAAEYSLLVALHAFFLVSFQDFYEWWMAVSLGVIMFGLNFQLTLLREQRRMTSGEERSRIMADTFESVLFLALIVVISLGQSFAGNYDIGTPEYLGYVAAILGGIFLAGILGEVYWQLNYFQKLSDSEQRAYIANLRRTILIPSIASRSR